MNSNHYWLAMVACIVLCCSATAQTFTLFPTDDNFGTGSNLLGPIVGLGPAANANVDAYAQAGAIRRLGMEFDITALPPAANIGSATLKWFHHLGTGTFDVYGYSGNGTVSVADLNNLSTLLLTAVPQANWGSMDVTTFIQSLKTSSASHAGFVGTSNSPISGHPHIKSSEWTVVELRPQLIITQVPEPSTAMMAMIGIAALSLRRQKLLPS